MCSPFWLRTPDCSGVRSAVLFSLSFSEQRSCLSADSVLVWLVGQMQASRRVCVHCFLMSFMAKFFLYKQGSGNRRYPCCLPVSGIGEKFVRLSCQCPSGMFRSDAHWHRDKSAVWTNHTICTVNGNSRKVRFIKNHSIFNLVAVQILVGNRARIWHKKAEFSTRNAALNPAGIHFTFDNRRKNECGHCWLVTSLWTIRVPEM